MHKFYLKKVTQWSSKRIQLREEKYNQLIQDGADHKNIRTPETSMLYVNYTSIKKNTNVTIKI